MWTMIIADDEPLITRGIQKMIDWKALGVEIIGSCEDGSSALVEITKKRPDIAILDVSMPGKTGLDILRELKCMESPTKVIFISGFQEFEYAVEALRLGAVNYLIKPVNRNELTETVRKCLDMEGEKGQEAVSHKGKTDYESLVQLETAEYIPAAVDILLSQKYSRAEIRLMQFSIYHAVEQYVQDKGLGIAFQKDEKICVVFKNHTMEELYEICGEMIEKIREEMGAVLGIVLGNAVASMASIWESYYEALQKTEYFYFLSLLDTKVLDVKTPAFKSTYGYGDLKEARQRMVEASLDMDKDRIRKEFEVYRRIVGLTADGDKETAVFQLLTIIQFLEERLDQMGISTEKLDRNQMISAALKCPDYDAMCQTAYEFLMEYMGIMHTVLEKNEKKDIIRAKTYIEDHYMDNLTLDVMADYVHMNASYFSSYFKRHTGQNFKEYLNQIRLRHALDLLLSTDMKAYEISDAVGFKDPKYLSDLFQKNYGKTPMAYRKELRRR